LVGLGSRRVEDWAAVVADGREEHSQHSALSLIGMLVPLADHLTAEGMEMSRQSSSKVGANSSPMVGRDLRDRFKLLVSSIYASKSFR
jgi:hypothetical protein